jgi:hypothetical protein
MWRAYWFHTDETNLDRSQGTFFIYGGFVMTPEQMAEVHHAVRDLRAAYKYEPGDDFKFHTKSRPSQITIDTWTESKAAILSGTADIGIDMIVYVVHHGIAANQPVEKRMKYALNATVTKFDMGYLAPRMKSASFASIGLTPSSDMTTCGNAFSSWLSFRTGVR